MRSLGAVAVAVAFFLCWAPFHAQRVMAVYGKATQTTNHLFRNIYLALTYVSGVLYFLSTCINPLLYSIMSHKFRDAFKVSVELSWNRSLATCTTSLTYIPILLNYSQNMLIQNDQSISSCEFLRD